MIKRIGVRQKPGRQTTRFHLSGPDGVIIIDITCSMCPRRRRAIGLAFVRQIRPFFEYFRHGDVWHWDDSSLDPGRGLYRGLFVPKSSAFGTNLGKLGFGIRMQRLKIGLSQEELAEQIQVHADHLSKIERGFCFPHRSTLRRLEAALGMPLIDTLPPRRKGKKPELAQGVPLGTQPWELYPY